MVVVVTVVQVVDNQGNSGQMESLSMTAESDSIDRLVEQAGALYSPPHVALELLELTRDPQIDARRLKQCLEQDPALAARVLRVVNSSLFGLNQQVTDLNQALALLGVNPLKLLVLGFNLPEELLVGLAGDVLGRHWQRALTKSTAARAISRLIRPGSGDDAFVAGLLQDVGSLVLLQQLREPYVALLRSVGFAQHDLRALERQALGWDHYELSSRLLLAWGLPAVFSRAVRGLAVGPAEIISTAEQQLARVVHLAELVSDTLIDVRPGAYEQLHAAAREAQISAAALDQILESVQQHVEQLADRMAVALPNEMDFAAVLDRARQQAAQASVSVVDELLRTRRETEQARGAQCAAREEVRALEGALAAWRRAGSPVAEVNPVIEPRPEIPPPAGGRGPWPAEVAETRVAWGPAWNAAEDSALTGRVQAAIGACRERRRPLSVLLVEVEDLGELVFGRGVARTERLLDFIEQACQDFDHPLAQCVNCCDSRFAVLLPECDRRTGLELANQLLAEVRALRAAAPGATKLAVSLGLATVALPPKNFPANELLTSAGRCLGAARLSGGNTIKSLELC